MKMNDENSSNREVHEEIKTDLANGHISKTKITSTVPNTTLNEHNKEAYHKGYVQGEVSENQRKTDGQKVRDNDNAARGLLLGIILASVVGLVLGTTYFLNRRDEAPIIAPLVVPVPRANQPSPPPNSTRTIEKEKTIIERIVPVPQASPVQKASPVPQPSPAEKVAPSPQVNPAPNININVPNSRQDAPAQQAPAPSAPSNNINITVPSPQKEPASTAPSPAPQSSTAPSPTAPTPAPQSSTAPSPTPPNPSPQSSNTPSPSQTDDASGAGTSRETNTESRNNSNPTNTASPGSNSGADGATGSQQ